MARQKKDRWKPRFLEAFADTGMVTEACRVAGVGRSSAYRERRIDEDFALAWESVEERATEELEAEAVRRAKDGSDTLLIFLLKSRRPGVYREYPRPATTAPAAPQASEEEIDAEIQSMLDGLVEERLQEPGERQGLAESP